MTVIHTWWFTVLWLITVAVFSFTIGFMLATGKPWWRVVWKRHNSD